MWLEKIDAVLLLLAPFRDPFVWAYYRRTTLAALAPPCG